MMLAYHIVGDKPGIGLPAGMGTKSANATENKAIEGLKAVGNFGAGFVGFVGDVISTPGNVLRVISQDIGSGNFTSLPGDVGKAITGEKKVSVLDLFMDKEAQTQFQQSHIVLYVLADSTTSLIDPATVVGGSGVKALTAKTEIKVATTISKGTVKTGDAVWDMTKGGKTINGRWYSEHSLERMAPDTPQVRAELEARALDKGLQRGTEAFNKYVDPRGIPPSVVEDAIQNGTRTAGKTAGTWVYEGGDVRVIVNNSGGVVTVIPK